MELEGAYLGALGRVTGGERDGEQLVLRGDDLELRFASRPAVTDAELAGTTWQLDTLVDGDAASSTVAGAEATLEVADGQLSGTTGCNRFWGPAEVVDGRLVAGPLSTTRMACDGVMGQEGHALAVLDGRPTIGIEGDRLTLSLDDGRSLVYRAR
jgi:heat shock protein HslJ